MANKKNGCTRCKGTGAIAPRNSAPLACPACNGTGRPQTGPTAFQEGNTVIAKVTAQGMVKDARYTVREIVPGPFGIVTYGIQPARGGAVVWVNNGHLLLGKVEG